MDEHRCANLVRDFDGQIRLCKEFLTKIFPRLESDAEAGIFALNEYEGNLHQMIKHYRDDLSKLILPPYTCVGSAGCGVGAEFSLWHNNVDNGGQELDPMALHDARLIVTDSLTYDAVEWPDSPLNDSNSGVRSMIMDGSMTGTITPSATCIIPDLYSSPVLPETTISGSISPLTNHMTLWQPESQPCNSQISAKQRRTQDSRHRRSKTRSRNHKKTLHPNTELCSKMSSLLDKGSQSQVRMMYIFYQAIGSSDSIVQLREIINFIQESAEWRFKSDVSSITKTVQSLDRLEKIRLSAAFLRRILLLRLAGYHDENAKRHVAIEEGSNINQETEGGGGGKIESILLDELMLQAYPDLDSCLPLVNRQEWRHKHAAKRTNLKNCLAKAKKWRYAVNAFQIGIIALVPTGGEFGIQNQRFETLHDRSCEVLMEFLAHKDNEFISQASTYLTPLVQDVYDGVFPPHWVDISKLRSVRARSVPPIGTSTP